MTKRGVVVFYVTLAHELQTHRLTIAAKKKQSEQKFIQQTKRVFAQIWCDKMLYFLIFSAVRATLNKRSVVISRSTYPSSGKYVGHWLGDNNSIWPHLKQNIIGLLEFNLFGIPYVNLSYRYIYMRLYVDR